MQKHAKLSASGSHRWILCPGSVKAEEAFPEVKSKYADEGILAHEIAAAILNKEDISGYDIPVEMDENIQLYVDYIKEISPEHIWYPEIYIEKRVDFSHIVPGGFGTADAVIVANNTLHIVDLKYGMNNVTAYENTQLLLYAIGMYRELENKDNINTISVHIVQPRTNNFDKWTLSIKEMSFFEGYFKAKAEEALRNDAPRIPSEDACKWCRANSTCPALYKFAAEVMDIKNNHIDDEQTKYILDNSNVISNFINSVKGRVYDKLSMGLPFPGYKLVAGRNIRKIRDNIDNKLFELLGEKAYIKSLIGVTALEKLVDKETLESLVYVSNCKPVLVLGNDKRKALEFTELEFDAVEDDLLS
jgi:hypothetical protein